ncbi:NPC intracellular cholesterol transporter 1-like [Ornithodoros turicata]|uniref:NPC intracellular cholesterol transporter 1-like n=1 Tax=Ornithodoros turicata TaxID=34597 RepID=UPI00313907EE
MWSPWHMVLLLWLFANVAFNVDGRCVFTGHCGNDEDTDKPIPCSVYSNPTPTLDDSVWQTFEQVCPQLASETSHDHKVCCDSNQIRDMARELEQPAKLGMAKCPGCMLNFKDLLCRMTCSPQQSEFIFVNATQRGVTGLHVSELVYALSRDFAHGVYDTCKDVRSVLGVKLMTLMCNGRFSGCSPQYWLDFLGSTPKEGGYAPFHIHHLITDAPLVQLHGAILKPLRVPHFPAC